MTKKARALRELAELSLSGAYEDVVYPSIDAVAERTGVSRSTIGRAVHTLCGRGAAEWTSGSQELILCSKSRAVDSYKTLWDRSSALVGRVTAQDAERLVMSRRGVWGGHRAASEHLGRVAATPMSSSVYVVSTKVVTGFADGDVPVYLLDADALPCGGVVGLAQTLTELFNTPGFVSHEFYEALWSKYVAGTTMTDSCNGVPQRR